MAAVGLILPFISHAQGIADEMKGLHGVLEQLYDEMMPLCSQLIGVGQGLAGFAAMWYIASRVWGHLSRAEPIDFYPLFRPFVIGFCVLFFPTVVLGVINGVMKPTVTATAAMVEGSDKAIAVLVQQKEEASKKTDVRQRYEGERSRRDMKTRVTTRRNGELPGPGSWVAPSGKPAPTTVRIRPTAAIARAKSLSPDPKAWSMSTGFQY